MIISCDSLETIGKMILAIHKELENNCFSPFFYSHFIKIILREEIPNNNNNINNNNNNINDNNN